MLFLKKLRFTDSLSPFLILDNNEICDSYKLVSLDLDKG